jgi:Tol biopolymer transport system component
MTIQRYLLPFLVAATLAAQPKNPDAALGAARHLEEAEGNYPAAIEAYKKFLAQYDKDRVRAAKALVRMGQCYEKLGDAEARKAYERVVREFGDQQEPVASARARLSALGAGEGRTTSYRQIWSGPSVNYDSASVSRDGRYLTYVDRETRDLSLHDFSTGTDRRLTNLKTSPGSHQAPDASAISRDGKQIAYGWWKWDSGDRFELRVAAIPGDGFLQPRRLIDREDISWVNPHDWSPDGKWVAAGLLHKDRTWEIALVSTEDGSLRSIKTRVAAGSQPNGMFFSPDGKYVGFDLKAGQAAQHDIVIVSLDKGAEAQAVESPFRDEMMGWSPDGRYLLFASDRTGSTALWAVAVADGRPTAQPELIQPNLPSGSLGVTASGVLYVGVPLRTRGIQIAPFDLAAGKLAGPVTSVDGILGSSFQPNWSHDGNFLAYVSVRAADDRGISIYSVQNGQTREVRPKLSMFNLPRWAPDGRSFLAMGTQQGRQGVYSIDAATGESTPVAVSSPGSQYLMPQWSPDGKRIYYFSSLPSFEMALMEREVASGKERELLRRPLGQYSGSDLSPDGRYVAAVTAESPTEGKAAVLVSTAGGASREILRVEGAQMLTAMMSWTPDSRGVIVHKLLHDATDNREVWLVPIEGGAPRRLEIDGRKIAQGGRVLLDPTGRRIAYLSGEAKLEVWALENFLPRLNASAK